MLHRRKKKKQEPEKKPDYEQQVQKELDRIQQRILLLNEMLNNAKEKERFVDGDAYDVSRLAERSSSDILIPRVLPTANCTKMSTCPAQDSEVDCRERRKRSRVDGCVCG